MIGLSSPSELIPQSLIKQPGSFLWWYVDACDQLGNGFVLICTGAFLLKMMIVFSETEHVDVVPLTLWKSLAPIWNLIVVIIALMLAFAFSVLMGLGIILF